MSNRNGSQVFQPDCLEGFVLTRAWWTGLPLSERPLAEFVVQRDAPLPYLVHGLLGAIGFREDHLWCLAHPRKPVGRRRVGTQHTWSVPVDWRCIRGPADAAAFDDDAGRAEYADAFSVNELGAGDNDEAWLLFDFGDHHTFRFKFNAFSSQERPARSARLAFQRGALALPSFEDGQPVVVLQAVPVEQYPLYDNQRTFGV